MEQSPAEGGFFAFSASDKRRIPCGAPAVPLAGHGRHPT